MRKPTTRPGLLDVPVKRKTKKSTFLRNLERKQYQFNQQQLIVEAANEQRKQRVREAAERGLFRNRAPKDGKVTPIKGFNTWPKN